MKRIVAYASFLLLLAFASITLHPADSYNTMSSLSLFEIESSSILPSALATEGNACAPGGTANKCCAIWNVTITSTFPWPTISCSTGGVYKCEDCEP